MDPQHDDADNAARTDAYPLHPDVEADAANDPVQAAVRTLLRSAPDPGPMPAEVSRRIEDALAQAAARRAENHELFDELGFGEPGALVAAEDPDDVIVFAGDHEGPRGSDDDTVVPFLRRRWPVVGAAAAAVAVLAIGGVVVANQLGGGSGGLAAIPPQAATGGSAGSVHVQVSTTAYTKDSLVSGAQTLIASPGPDASVGDAPSAGPLVTQAGAAACVQALQAGDAGAVSIDLATYEGQPAAIVVVRRSDSTSVYAVQRDCGDGDAGVIQDAVAVP
jgi:hypothetical protein